MGWTGKESMSYATQLGTTPTMAKYKNETTGTQLITSFTMWLGIPGAGVEYNWAGDKITGTGNPIEFYVSINDIESSHVTVDNPVGASSGTEGYYPKDSDLKQYTVTFDEDVIVDPGKTVNVMGTYNDKMDSTKFIVARKRKEGVNEYVSGEVVNATYTISYNANGGSGAPSPQTKYHGTDINLSSTSPTRSGYTFLGWSTNKAATSATYQPGATFNLNEDTTLYAVWKAITYTVDYDANGGSGKPKSQTKTHGVNLTLSSSKPTKSYTITYNANGGSVSPSSKSVSCTFNSWNTNKYGGGTKYDSGGTYTANASATLYAQWTNNKADTLATPTREGHKFIGWFTKVEGGIQVTADTIINSDITLYAIWEAEKCAIWVYTEDGWTHFSGTALRYDGTGWNKLGEQ